MVEWKKLGSIEYADNFFENLYLSPFSQKQKTQKGQSLGCDAGWTVKNESWVEVKPEAKQLSDKKRRACCGKDWRQTSCQPRTSVKTKSWCWRAIDVGVKNESGACGVVPHSRKVRPWWTKVNGEWFKEREKKGGWKATLVLRARKCVYGGPLLLIF